MKSQTKKSIHTQNIEDLKKQVQDLKRSLDKIRVDRYTKPSKNVRERKNMRKLIAQLLTEIRARALKA